MIRLLFFFALVISPGCSSGNRASIVQQTSFDSRPTLIFVHGYYGSTLREVGTDRRVFITAWEALFGRKSLSLYSKELATPEAVELEVEGLLGSVPIVPFVYSVDVYGAFLDYADALPQVQTVALAYDWRKDLGEAVGRLDHLVKTLEAKGVKKIVILAHSMGGLVTSYYLGYGNQPSASAKLNWDGARHVQSVVFMGAPFGGAVGIFSNFQRGAEFAWNASLLPAEAVATFPSSYALLPTSVNLIDHATGQPIPFDLSSPDNWEKYGLGLLARKDLPAEIIQRRKEFTAAQVKNFTRFLKQIQFTPAPAPASLGVLNVVGRGRKTTAHAYLNTTTRELIFPVDKPTKYNLASESLMEEGDGTVLVAAAQLPPALAARAKVLESTAAHDRLFEDEKVKAEIVRLFQQ